MSWPSCDIVVCSFQMQHNINLSKKMHCAVHMSKIQHGFMNWIEFMHQIHCSRRVQTIQSTCTHMQSASHSALYLHTYRISYLSFHLHQIIVYWIVCIKWHLSISINQCQSSSSSYMRKVDLYINRHLLIIFDFLKLSISYQYHIHQPINAHLSLIHWSCSLKLQTFFPQHRLKLDSGHVPVGLNNPYGLWWIAESYHGPQSTWSINMLFYKILMIHDQHSISLVEYVYDARRWCVSPFMTKRLRFQSTLTSAMLRMKPSVLSQLSAFSSLKQDMPVESTCDSLSQGVHWGATHSSGDQVPGRLWTAIVWLKMKLWMKLLGFIGDSITLIEKFMQSVLSLCLLKTSPKGWLINIERLK